MPRANPSITAQRLRTDERLRVAEEIMRQLMSFRILPLDEDTKFKDNIIDALRHMERARRLLLDDPAPEDKPTPGVFGGDSR